MSLGFIGGLPYLASSGTTVYFAHQAGLVASGAMLSIDPTTVQTLLDQALSFQVTYGAALLSSLGAMHWGMELAGYGGRKGYSRFALGAVPMMFALPSLGMLPLEGILLQWIGFMSIWWADLKVSQQGWGELDVFLLPENFFLQFMKMQHRSGTPSTASISLPLLAPVFSAP